MTINPTNSIAQDTDVVIASGESLTESVNLGGNVVTGFYMPASWTAAAVTFQASYDGSTFADLYSAGAELSVTVSSGQYVALDPQIFLGVQHVRLRSGTAGTPVNQGADRTFKIVVGRPDG